MKANFFDNKVNILKDDGSVYMEGVRAGKTMYHLRLRSRVNTEHAAVAAGQQSSTTLWHERMGHVSLRNIRRMFTMGLIEGLYLNDTEEDLKAIQQCCLGCAKGKMSRHPYPKICQYQTSTIGERIHSDACGPMSYTSLGGARFITTFKDEFSGRTGVFFMKNKSEMPSHFESFRAMLENQTGKKIKILRTDNAGEYESAKFTNRLAELGIKHETSAPYAPQQNGVAERENRTLIEMARCMIHSSKTKMPLWIWGEAVAYAAYILNRIPSTKSKKSPFEVWTGRKPNLAHIRVFGSRTFVHIPDARRTKLDAKCVEGVLVGYCENTKAYRVYIPSQRRVAVSRDVIIDEAVGYIGNISYPEGTDSFITSQSDPFIQVKSKKKKKTNISFKPKLKSLSQIRSIRQLSNY